MVDPKDNPNNPKQRYGIVKPSAEFTPPVAEMWLHSCMQEGAGKYGPFNWRIKPVEAGTYYSAIRRHSELWMSGEQFDPKTKRHHLGYVMACCAILLDAEMNGCMIDNRPKDDGKLSRLMDLLTQLNQAEQKRAALEPARPADTPQVMGTSPVPAGQRLNDADMLEEGIRQATAQLRTPEGRPLANFGGAVVDHGVRS